MPWCPKCRVEYREGFSICGDCGADLVNQLPPPATTEEPPENNEDLFDSSVHLITVSDATQATMIESLLAAHNIGTRKQYKSPGSYLKVFCGMSVFGVDIFVLSHDLHTARELIHGTFDKQESNNGEETSLSQDTPVIRRKEVTRWLIFVYLLLSLCAVLLYAILD